MGIETGMDPKYTDESSMVAVPATECVCVGPRCERSRPGGI